MVKLEDSQGKSGEGYARILGNEQMAVLLSKLQAAVIRGGFELEQMIEEATASDIITTLDELNNITQTPEQKPPVQVVFRPSRPDPEGRQKSIQADLLIVDNRRQLFMLVEIKDGYVFDTKKADGELSSLKSITSWLAQEYPYRAQYFLCAFNQDNKEMIVHGAKKRFTLDHVMTGRELCEKIGVNYDGLCHKRALDQYANRHYFLSSLLNIPEIRDELLSLIQPPLE